MATVLESRMKDLNENCCKVDNVNEKIPHIIKMIEKIKADCRKALRSHPKQSPLPLNNMNEISIIKPFLYEGKIFNTWQQAFEIIEGWAKQQGFKIKYGRVEKNPDGSFRKRTIQCEHQGKYISKSNKQTTTKRIGCMWHVNLSEPQSENLLKHIYITTFHGIHSHDLNSNVIQFGNNKNLSSEILREIEFLTIQCKLGATSQRQYLEARFPGQIIYNEDLYYAIQSFRPQNKNDSNDAAKLYTKLLENSQNNSMWKVAIKFDDNNTLTHLFWMTPSQVELWYQFSDIVVQDVTCKTNRYDMALSLFVILDENRNIRLVAQALLIDETKESHEWTFNQINLVTNNLHPRVIMTDADPAVHAAIRSTFLTTYPMNCTFHISQNLIKKLQKTLGKKFYEFSLQFHKTRNTLHKPFFEANWKALINQYPEVQNYLNNVLYNTKEAWAHPWTCRQFTAGLHASSPVESINAWIKSYIFNSNISLCELADVIEKRQLSEDKNHQLILWKAAIPCVSTQITVPAFMFTTINKKLEEYLPSAILELQRNEIRQCIFYDAIQINQEEIDEFNEHNFSSDQHLEDIPDARQTTASCMISDVNKEQITSMWAITVENNLIEKHFIILLSNGSHHCSCLSLINRGIVCRHYFQIMLRSSTAKFHLRLIPSRWYYKNKDPSQEPFLVATKFKNEITSIIPESNIPFLTAVNYSALHDSITQHERLTDIQLYGKITGLTHKVTMKAIRKKDVRIIDILEEYLKDDEEQGENIDLDENIDHNNLEDVESNKENELPALKNPNKQKKSKGRPKGTKRIKAFYEKTGVASTVVNKQYKCSQCGSMGHNKRNCNQIN
ncbi:hypothetical protein Glove_232g96 [Diversispora epigaea]|uniref:SWIM-type domain-containing protein n=1 Tax=Diversispora epigaea TaxID=1348612 RepID=A0A397IHC2_9GLOM|nr:hypothetical protein Glove_232g96 [Diversispora epigaea]